MNVFQTTIQQTVKINGNALHSGQPVTMTLSPLAANSGIIFKRVDLTTNNIILANYQNVSSTLLCTEISNAEGAKVATIEHLMAAFFFLGIDNVLVEVDNTELPACDGSAYGFIEAILKVGLKVLNTPKVFLEILQPVEVVSDKWQLRIAPSDKFMVKCDIDFEVIGKQSYLYEKDKHLYSSDIYKAKTFGYLKDVERFHKQGIGLGASINNTNIITDEGVLEGCILSSEDDFVKHKILDLCGDLYLCGYAIKGEVTASKPGHLANNSLLKAVLHDKQNYSIKPYHKSVLPHFTQRENPRVINY